MNLICLIYIIYKKMEKKNNYYLIGLNNKKSK